MDLKQVVLIALALALALAPSRLPAQARPAVALRSDSIVRVARGQARSVVSLHTIERPTAGDQSEGLGSAVVVGRDGLLLTNAHVVEGAAVIPATFGDSDRIEPGAFVVAIGSPVGLHHTVTAGILSAKARGRDDSGLEFLQTDAAVNSGSSGGGLFDLQGRLVGITSGILAPPGGGNVGLNFAIPVNVIKALLPQLQTGIVRHGWLGVSTRGARAPQLTPRTRNAAPVLEILELAAGSPAEQAGVRSGDLLAGALVSGRGIPANRIHQAVWLAQPGTAIELSVSRNGRVRNVLVTLGSLPQAP